jgi:hypothetical protein
VTRASIRRTSSPRFALIAEKDLLQNVLFRVAAAETVHPVEDWFHEIDGTGVFTSPMSKHSSDTGIAIVPTTCATAPSPRPNIRIASSIRRATSSRRVAASAIIQCG